MKLLTKLEKSKAFWYLLGTSLTFFLLRLPSLIEPNWYGDEGIYQVIGQAIVKGRLLYGQIWDNKPPLLYLTYALFHGDQFQVRLFALIVGLFTIWVFFYISQLLFKQKRASIISTICFALLFATPLLEGNIANAENFMLFPTIAAGVLVYAISSKLQNSKFLILNSKFLTLFFAGLLLGIAFLFKIVAVFDFAAFLTFFSIINLPENLSWSFFRRLSSRESKAKRRESFYSHLLPSSLFITSGFTLPIIITALYFLTQNAFSDFKRAIFSSNVGYVGYGNKLIIPQGFLILKLFLLASAVFIIFWKRKQFSKSTTFIILWFAFSLFNTFFSGRAYTHYLLVSLPSFCLLIGLFVVEVKTNLKISFLLLLVTATLLFTSTFKLNYKKTFQYYLNAVSFLALRKDINSYQSFFDQKTPRDYEIASFIKTHTNSKDSVFIWGDSAQIYALSEKIPPGRYTVAYHITQYKFALQETQTALDKTNPKYIVVLSESSPLPLYLPAYTCKLIFKHAVIYERGF